MVREEKNTSSMKGISELSYLHAKYFDELGGCSQFRTKGRVQVGADADIVVSIRIRPQTTANTRLARTRFLQY
ncbi:hypothetical protein [Seongchinamella unica]|uniref:hypothetical protein n=1 Tax=Seongchinamella unica TaxID=2547392 RepID=UPI001EEEECD9|nr:hypothetical protein [Seongchinamella unica]